MTSFSYTKEIPASGNDPSVDQPNMKTNTDSINDILAVDHVTFNVADGGTHKQVTMSSKNTPAAQTDPQSVIYTANGTASTNAQVFFVNAAQTLLLSIIKAYGFANSSGIVSSQSVNVSSVVRNSAGNYTVTLTGGAVATADYGVLVSPAYTSSQRLISSYSITNATTFNLYFGTASLLGPTDPDSFTFVVLQR